MRKNELLRVGLRLLLIAAIFAFVIPHLPGVRYGGSLVMSVVLAAPLAVLHWWGHRRTVTRTVARTVSGPLGRTWQVNAWESVWSLPSARRWIVVTAIVAMWFVAMPSGLLWAYSTVPAATLALRGPYATLLPALFFLAVHVLSDASGSMTREAKRELRPASDA